MFLTGSVEKCFLYKILGKNVFVNSLYSNVFLSNRITTQIFQKHLHKMQYFHQTLGKNDLSL